MITLKRQRKKKIQLIWMSFLKNTSNEIYTKDEEDKYEQDKNGLNKLDIMRILKLQFIIKMKKNISN